MSEGERAGAETTGAAPRVSVVLPVHNGARTVANAVSSILGQTFTNFELVVVDDGSTDDTPSVLEGFADDPRLRVLRNETNLGLVRSLNRGIDAARGALIARLDDDDTSMPTRLGRQTAIFDRHPDTVLCATGYRRVDPAGGLVKEVRAPVSQGELMVKMLRSNRLCHSSVMFDRTVAQSAGGYDERWFPVEDFELWWRLLRIGVYRAVPSVEVDYLENPAGISAQRRARQTELMSELTGELLREYSGRAERLRRLAVLADLDRVRIARDAVRGIEVDLDQRGIDAGDIANAIRSLAHDMLPNRSRLRRLGVIAAGMPGTVGRSVLTSR